MSNEIPHINDRRGLLFTINRNSYPLYQVESRTWAHADNRWNHDDIPQAIHDKVKDLRETGKPGVFARFLQGEVGVYVIYENHIKNLPEAAAPEFALELPETLSGARALAPYDIVICTKGGPIHTENGETSETQEGDFYVIRCQCWGRFFLPPPKQPDFVTTTRSFLLLLDDLHGKNFLSMSPDPTGETLPPDVGEPMPAIEALNCYVLNLSHFKR